VRLALKERKAAGAQPRYQVRSVLPVKPAVHCVKENLGSCGKGWKGGGSQVVGHKPWKGGAQAERGTVRRKAFRSE
jgi:hypothetical protein